MTNENHEHEFGQIRDDIKIIQRDDRTQVTWTVFWSIVVLLVGSFSVLYNNQAEELKELSVTVQDNRLSAATIQTQLAQIQMDVLDIKVSLKEHSN